MAGEARRADVLAHREAVRAEVSRRGDRDPRALAVAAAAFGGAGALVVLDSGAVDELALVWSASQRHGAENGRSGPAAAGHDDTADVGHGAHDVLVDAVARTGGSSDDVGGALDAVSRIDGGFSGFEGALAGGLAFERNSGGGHDGGGVVADGGGGGD